MLNPIFHNQGSILTLRCSGRIVLGKTDEIVCAAIRLHAKEVILELSEVNVIDVAGIGALLTLQAAGIYLKLVNPTAAVRSVLRLTNTDRVFEICESRTVPASAPATDHESAAVAEAEVSAGGGTRPQSAPEEVTFQATSTSGSGTASGSSSVESATWVRATSM